ncbi:hypothetical protein Esti_002191 [Eimeria stiedai]
MRPPCASDDTGNGVNFPKSPRPKAGDHLGMATPSCSADSGLKAEVEIAFQERERLSEQMEALSSFLTAEGMPGLHGPLVDEEGFPRADIGVYAVREARHRLACLQTDYRNAQRHLEELLFRLHAESSKGSENGTTPREPAPTALRQEEKGAGEDVPPRLHEAEGPAFALVDVLQPQSPSSAAGLVCGDKILRLGSLRLPSARDAPAGHTSGNGNNDDVDGERGSNMTVSELFRLLPGEVERHKDQRMPVVVKRRNRVLSLWLTPHEWAGRGLLGCHLRPISQD